jgi:hypothetical protein
MNEDRVAGTARNLGGKVQEGVGRVTGDATTKVEGVINQVPVACSPVLRGAFELIFGHSDAVTAETRVVFKVRPRHRIVIFPHPQKPPKDITA